MDPSSERVIILELVARSANPVLLEGLDAWLKLGLLSDETVRQICQEQLTCLLPESPVAEREISLPTVAQTATDDLASPLPRSPQPATLDDDFPPPGESETQEPAYTPGWLGQVVRSFMAELSVVWLLFLGVFMVVVSSGVLAATQWRNFSPVGQYLILLAYTIAFWVAGMVTNHRTALRLTSRMLQTATLLIIPVNFWMMDGFRLWGNVPSQIVATLAALGLTLMTAQLLKPRPTEPDNTRLTLITAIALSWLHWGWSLTGLPLVATYVGTIGAALSLAYQDRAQGDRESADVADVGDDGTVAATPYPFTIGFIAVIFGALLLLGRAIFVAQVPITDLGLAAGICGWLLCWLSRRDIQRRIWSQVGAMLLLLGWLVAVTVTPPWQALAISGLALGLLGDYLRRLRRVEYLTAGFLVGLQLFWLLWRVLPPQWQQQIIDRSIQLAGPDTMPLALAGLWFFPYLVFTLWFAFRLRHWQSPDLAKQAELLALVLGGGLAVLSAGNPLVRFLNLTLSALTLVWFIRQRAQREEPLIYLAHGTGLGAIAAGVYQFLPALSWTNWAMVAITGASLEWIFSAVTRQPSLGRQGNREDGFTPSLAGTVTSAPAAALSIWQQSAWHYGLVLAAVGYVLLVNQPWQESPALWNLAWLVIPLGLTGLAYRRYFPQWRLAGWFSVLALFLAQGLVVDFAAGRLVGFGMGTVLMLLNTHKLQHLLAAVLTVGFGLVFTACAIWETYGETLTFGWGINLVAIAILLLWMLRGGLLHRESSLAVLYQKAADGWAVAIAILACFLVSVAMLVVYLGGVAPNWQYLSTASLILLATAYRLWQSPLRGGVYLLAWTLELVVTGIIALTGRSLDAVAIANLALGLGTQLLGDWQASTSGTRSIIRRTPPVLFPLSWHLIPLLYATFGLILQHRTFTATTGLYTLAAALVGIGVGRRQLTLKPLTYLSVLGITFGTYELLLYQLMQAQGGSAGDGIVLLAALAVVLAIAFYLLTPWLIPYLRLNALEIRSVAYLHWVLGCIFLLGALFTPRSSTGEWWWVGVAAIHAVYALVMGNRYWVMGTDEPSTAGAANPSSTALAIWTYAGIIEVWVVVAYLLHLLLPDVVLIDWAGAIAAILACLLYLAPWHRWGWEQDPWRKTAAILPGVVVMLTAWGIPLQGLLLVAAFYAWLARAEQQVRLSYISVLLADWAIFRWLNQIGITQPIWYAAVLSASLLYIAQIDPGLRSPTDRERRHLLRSLATALVCLTALYQSEAGIAGITPILVGFLSLLLALGFVLAGILLRVRAFLYVGTATFIIQLLRQLWRFVNDYPISLWIVISAIGLAFIWVAATFEARRSQITNLVQYWTAELDEWE